MSKSIDIERLKIDLAYWNQVAPNGATHFRKWKTCPVLFYKKICKGVWERFFGESGWQRGCCWDEEEQEGVMIKKPEICPRMWAESESYRKGVGTPINGFYYVFPKPNNENNLAFFAETMEIGKNSAVGVKSNGDGYHVLLEYWDYVEALEEEESEIPSEGDYVVVNRLTESQHDWIGEKWVEWGIGRGECGMYYDCAFDTDHLESWVMGVRENSVFHGGILSPVFKGGRDITDEMLGLWRDAHSSLHPDAHTRAQSIVDNVISQHTPLNLHQQEKKIGTFYHSKNFEQMDNAKVVEACNVDECLGSLRLWLDEHPETRIMAIWDKLVFDGKTYDVEIGVDVVC